MPIFALAILNWCMNILITLNQTSNLVRTYNTIWRLIKDCQDGKISILDGTQLGKQIYANSTSHNENCVTIDNKISCDQATPVLE